MRQLKNIIIDLSLLFLFLVILCSCSKPVALKLELNGGTLNGERTTIEAKKGEPITLPTPTKKGYSFAGWFSNKTLTESFTSTTMPKKGLTLYAK